MTTPIKGELRRVFHLAAMRREAAAFRTPRQWSRAQDLMNRCQLLRGKEIALFELRRTTRTDREYRRLLDGKVGGRPELRPGWASHDVFDRDALLRQANRNVAAHHRGRLDQIDRIEARKLATLVDQARAENGIQGKARRDFQNAADPGPGPVRRRTGPS